MDRDGQSVHMMGVYERRLVGSVKAECLWIDEICEVSSFKAPRIQETAYAGDELLTLPVVVDIVTGPTKRENVRWLPPMST